MKKLFLISGFTALFIILTATVVFAWFNLLVKNESNFRISNFDISILVSNDINSFDTELQPNVPLFDFDGKYSLEPGDTQTKYLKIVNNGDIAVAYELLFIGTGDVLGGHIYVDVVKNSNTTSLIGTELLTASFGAGEELQKDDFVIYKLTATFNATLAEYESLVGQTFKLETIISVWQFNYDESKPTQSLVEVTETLDSTYTGWVDGQDHIIISYDTSDMESVRIEPKGVGLTADSELFVEYIKVDGELIDISYVSGVDPEGYSFNTEPMIKDIVTFSNYRYYYSNILCIKVIGEGESQGLEYIMIDLSNVDNLEVYLRCVDSKERIEFLVTKTEIN